MVRVTIEILPFGSEKRKKEIGRIEITNDGKGTARTGYYKAELHKSLSKKGGIWKTVFVDSFDRVRRGPYDLLYQVLREAVGERN